MTYAREVMSQRQSGTGVVHWTWHYGVGRALCGVRPDPWWPVTDAGRPCERCKEVRREALSPDSSPDSAPSPDQRDDSWMIVAAVVFAVIAFNVMVVYAFSLHVEEVSTPDPTPSISVEVTR